MDIGRGLLIVICLISGGCFPRETQSIGAVDPLNSIPAIQKAAANRDQKAVPALVGQLNNDDPAIRFYAINALERITGQTLDYAYYDEVDGAEAGHRAVAALVESKEAVTAAPRELRLRITSDPANLRPVRRQVEAFCAECGFDEQAGGEIVLCVNEALANITRHAYGGATDKPVELNATFSDGRLQLTLRDWGNGITPPNRPGERDPLRPGGVGLVCLRSLMDDISFTPQPDGMLLTMERKL